MLDFVNNFRCDYITHSKMVSMCLFSRVVSFDKLNQTSDAKNSMGPKYASKLIGNMFVVQ